MEWLTAILLGPITILVGIALMVYGILTKPKQRPLRRYR